MKCKCHGVSGSCSIKTCWKGLQELRDIALDLKTKYLSATKVVHRPMGTRKYLVPKDIDIRPVKETELIYLQSSPDFCMKNEKVGSHGTQDRWEILQWVLTVLWPQRGSARGEHVWIRGSWGGDIYRQVKHDSNILYGLPLPNPVSDGYGHDRACWHIFHCTMRHKTHFKIPGQLISMGICEDQAAALCCVESQPFLAVTAD